jgi:branched-chain amino acid transport system substrate-binding protein
MNKKFTMKKLALAMLGATVLGGALSASAPAQAQISGDVVKIGFITDMSGLLSDTDGQGGLEAIRMAIADFGGSVNGKKIELIFADHQNKADIAASKAREWFDREGLDMLIGGTNSSAALAMASIANDKKKPIFIIAAGSARLTNEDCTPYTVHYAYDTVSAAKVMGAEIVKLGGNTWYFLTADYAFGKSLEADTSKVVKELGGKLLGTARFPLATPDFSSFLLQAQASKAKILGLATSGEDTANSIKAANEFGLTKTMKLAGLLMYINDIHALTLQQAQGLYLTESWYWDLSPRPHLADNTAAEQQHAGDEHQAGHHRDRFAQRREPLDVGDAGQPGAEVAELVFQRDDEEGADDRADQVPMPPTSVIRMTRPDMVQCTSVSVSKPSTSGLGGAGQAGQRGRQHEGQQLVAVDVVAQRDRRAARFP